MALSRTQLLSELFIWFVRKMTTLLLSVSKEFWIIFRKEEIFGFFMFVHSSKFCNWASDIFLPNLLLNFLSLPSRRAHLLGSTVMPYLPHFDKFLFHPSISGTSLSRLVVKLLPSMFGSQGAIVKTWIGCIAVPL